MAAARLAEAWDAALRTFTGAKSQTGRIGESRRYERPYSEHAMTQAGSKATNEPSMEDILASIRRIIAEDYSAQQAAASAHQPVPAEPAAKPYVSPVSNQPAQPVMPAAPSDVLDLNSRGERFRPPMPEVVPVAPPSASSPQAPFPRVAPPTLRMAEPAQPTTSTQTPEMQGFAARAVSEFSERLGRSFAAAERYQREVQAPQRAQPVTQQEPVASATVEAVAAAVHSHLAAAQAVKMPEPQRAYDTPRDMAAAPRPEQIGVRAAAENRIAAARQQANSLPGAHPAPQVAQAPVSIGPLPSAVMKATDPSVQNDPPPAWLVSPRVSNSAAQSFKALQENKASPQPTLTEAQSSALQELMTAALRPMLKDWLDQHLPGMVERMITAEIQRVTRGQ